jgi:acyl carrier protein
MEWISKISEEFIIYTLNDKFDIDIQSFSKGTTFEEVGMDELDSIEFLMQIEKEYNISIKDEEWGVVEKDPSILFRSIIRNEKINKILEDE